MTVHVWVDGRRPGGGWPGNEQQSVAGLGWPLALGDSRGALPSSAPVHVSRETTPTTPTTPVSDASLATAEPEVTGDVSRETTSTSPIRDASSATAELEVAADVSRGTSPRRAPAAPLPAWPRPTATRILTIANQKGGVGKTTTCVNVAAAMASAGLEVLVIDIDPQGNASTALGIDHHADVPNVYDVLIAGVPLASIVQRCTTVDHLWCAPATIDLAGAELELVSMVARETRLARAVSTYLEVAQNQPETPRIDYVLIDCPPSLGLLTVNAFVAADELFIPIQCEYYALEGLSQLLNNVELIRTHLNPDLHVSTILLTMYDGRTRLSAQVADDVREHFPAEVLRTTVPRSVRISEAPSHGETVITYDATSSGALSYIEAAREIAARGVLVPTTA